MYSGVEGEQEGDDVWEGDDVCLFAAFSHL